MAREMLEVAQMQCSPSAQLNRDIEKGQESHLTSYRYFGALVHIMRPTVNKEEYVAQRLDRSA